MKIKKHFLLYAASEHDSRVYATLRSIVENEGTAVDVDSVLSEAMKTSEYFKIKSLVTSLCKNPDFVVEERPAEKKRLYVDMDGTLARFHDADKQFIEAMWQEGFYRELKPFENMVEGIKLFAHTHPEVETFILSAVLDTDPPFAEAEKNEWLDKYLPSIDKEHRIFTRAGTPKSAYIPDVQKNDFLIDDYNKNLREFEASGGSSVKFRNDINHRGLGAYGGERGELWQGSMIDYTSTPAEICSGLEKLMKLEPKQQINNNFLNIQPPRGMKL